MEGLVWACAKLVFRLHETLFLHMENPWGVLLKHKKPLREWGHALPRFSSLNHPFGGHKKPLREARGLTPWFGGGPVSNLVPPGCVVRVPTHWAICAPFRWRVPSKGAPIPTLEPIGVHLFRHGNHRFLTHNRALGVKMGGRRASF